MSEERAFLVTADWHYNDEYHDWYVAGTENLHSQNSLYVRGYGRQELEPGMIVILRLSTRQVEGVTSPPLHYWERIPTEENMNE